MPSARALAAPRQLSSMSLSSLLVQREVATLREVEEALARQVLYGGDLLLNLFEVARPDERALAAVLAEMHALEATSGGVLPPADDRALALVPPDMARRGVFVPATVDGDQLTVVVAEPLPGALENELSFALGVRLVQRIAPSFRIQEAIARDYRLAADRRVTRLLERLAAGDGLEDRGDADGASGSSDDGAASGAPRSEPLLGPELAVRAPPRAPSLHPSSPPPGPVAVKPKDRRKITEQGFPAVTPEMIAAALRAQSGSQEPAPPSSAAIPSSTSVALSPAIPPRTPPPPAVDPPAHDASTSDTVPRTLAAVPSGPELTAATPEGGAEAAPPETLHTYPARPTKAPQTPLPIPRPLPPSPNQIVTPVAFPSARDPLPPRSEASPATRTSKQTAPLLTTFHMRQPTPFLGTQTAGLRAEGPGQGQGQGPGARQAPWPGPSQVQAQSPTPWPALLAAPSPMQPRSAVQGQGPRVTHAVRAVRPLRRRRGPLVVDAAKRELDEALDRDTVLDVFFDFTRQYVDYAALFVVLGDLAEGRDAFGEGAPRDKVAGIGVPLELPSMLQTARNRRAVLQAVPSGGIDEELMTDLGRSSGSPVVLVPVVVRGRVVALFLGDSGPGGVEVDSLETIGGFALLAGQAFERLIVARKNRRPSVLPPPPTVAATPAARRDPVPTTRREGRSIAPPPLPSPGSVPPSSQSISVDLSLDSAPQPSPADEAPDDDATPIAPGVSASFDDALTPIAPGVGVGPGAVSPRSPREAPASSLTAPVTTKREGREGRDPREVHDPFSASLLTSEPISEPPSSRTGRRVSVPPHKPPTSKGEQEHELPSVIVDVDPAILELVSRFVRDGDPEIQAELLRMGQRAMPAIMAAFPGPLTADSERFARLDDATDPVEPPLRASECGPILRLIAHQRRVAVPFVLASADDPRHEVRFWATFLLLELPYAETATTLLARMFDAAPRTRRVARFAARLVAESGPHLFLDYLGRIAGDGESEPSMRALAVETLGELRQPRAVPLLIELLGAGEVEIARAAHRALVVLTCHDFDREPRKWAAWWSHGSAAHRVEWLMDALVADDEGRAEVAGLELKAVTKEYFGFQASLPRRERERSAQRYREWWIHEGRSRFRRD